MSRSSGSFKPGQSGNPGGRRRREDQTIKELARTHAPEAMKKLVEIMRGKKTVPSTRMAACREILDRAYGRPAQMIAGDPDNPVILRLEELLGVTSPADES